MRVSVIVPVYDDPRIEACLAAIVPQTRAAAGRGVEILVIDNGSREGIRRICRRFGRHVVYLSEPRPGAYAARNAGLGVARGELIAFTDADCLPAADWLCAGWRAFEDTAAQVVTGPVDVFAGDPERPGAIEIHQLCTAFQIRRYVDAYGFGPTANLWARAAVVRKVGLFDDSLRSGGDVEWCRRAVAAGFPVRFEEGLIVGHPARATWGAITANARRLTGGHLALASREKRVPELMRRRLWPRQAVGSLLSATRFSRAQRGMALLVELWLYVVRLAELGRLLLGGRPVR